MGPIKGWAPENFLFCRKIPVDNYAIIILNRPIKLDPYHFIQLWNKAYLRVTVDGGTDVWLNFKKLYCKNIDMKPVDIICGDFDSISSEALSVVKANAHSCVIHTPNQEETDFSKSLIELEPKIKDTHVRTIVVVAQTSGRIDQIMANINTLHKSKKFCSADKIYLLTDNSISFLLQPGKHSIKIPPSLVAKNDWCALIPFKGCTTLRTTGLKWNLRDQPVEFGSLVSTSNTYEADTQRVEVRTDQPVLWSMGTTTL